MELEDKIGAGPKQTVDGGTFLPSPGKSFRIRDSHIYLIIVLATLLVYGKSALYQYTYSDDTHLLVVNEELLSDFRNLPKLFTTDVFISIPNSQLFYRPLLNVLFMIEIHIAPDSPFLFHSVNILLHLLCSVLVFVVLKQLGATRSASGFASILFCVHPLNASAVVWIPGVNDTLLAAFVLSSFFLFLRALESQRLAHFVGHYVLYFLALLTKESAIVLPVLALGYVVFIRRERRGRSFWSRSVLAYGLVTLAWFALRSMVPQPSMAHTLGIPTLSHWFQNLPALLLYVGKTLLPYNLSVYPNLKDNPLWPGLVTVVALVAALILRRPKSFKKTAWGIGWFLLFLLPSFIAGDIFHEHRSYCALFGLFVVFAEVSIVASIDFSKKLHIVAAGVLVALFSFLAMSHSEEFRNRTAYATSAFTNDPSVKASYTSLAGLFLDEGNDVLAEKVLQKGLLKIPTMNEAHRMFADIYAGRHEYVRASREYELSIRLDPLQLYAYVGYAKMCLDMGRVDDAARLWKTAVAIDPNFILGYYYLANLYVRLKNDPDSAALYVKEIQRHGITVLPELLSDIETARQQVKGKQYRMQPSGGGHERRPSH